MSTACLSYLSYLIEVFAVLRRILPEEASSLTVVRVRRSGCGRACGLWRDETLALLVKGIQIPHDGYIHVLVRQGKDGQGRVMPVLPDHEQDVLIMTAGREPDEKVLARSPVRLEAHALRGVHAQALYRFHAPGRELTSPTGRLTPTNNDAIAAQKVSLAWGHARLSVVLTHYLRG